MGISSTGHVDHHLSELEKKGWITRIPGKSRGIKLTQRATGVPVKGAIAAGAPLDIYPDASNLLRVDDSWIQAEESYALLVRGDSMIEDSICDGDYVIIQPAPTCHDGDIVVVPICKTGSTEAPRSSAYFSRERISACAYSQPTRRWSLFLCPGASGTVNGACKAR